jgi:hypothetical protein
LAAKKRIKNASSYNGQNTQVKEANPKEKFSLKKRRKVQ